MEQTGYPDDRLNVVIVGAGRVGSSIAFASMITGLADRITLVDRDAGRAEGEAMDLLHGLPFVPPSRVQAGGFDACVEADVVVLTAGAARKPGDTRIDLSKRNLDLFADIVPEITAPPFRGVLLVVSNPVDLLTLATQRLARCSPERVIGTGTTLDTARLRSILARHFDVAARNVHAYVVGEHGETEVPVWSLARIANLDLEEFAQVSGKPWNTEIRNRIGNQVRTAGAEVIQRKGATYYAIALAVTRLMRAVLRDERTVLTVSTVLDNVQGVSDIALSMPCLIGRRGRLANIPLNLEGGEASALEESAAALRKAYREAGGPGE